MGNATPAMKNQVKKHMSTCLWRAHVVVIRNAESHEEKNRQWRLGLWKAYVVPSILIRNGESMEDGNGDWASVGRIKWQRTWRLGFWRAYVVPSVVMRNGDSNEGCVAYFIAIL